jgi:hypothetical protein
MAWELKYLLVAVLYFLCGTALEAWINRGNPSMSRNLPTWVYLGCAWFVVSSPGVLLLWILGS